MAQLGALRRPGLVRKIVVAGCSGPGIAPGTPEMAERVLSIMAKPDTDAEDLLYLFYPETEPARAAGLEHLGKVVKRLEACGPPVTEEAAQPWRGCWPWNGTS